MREIRTLIFIILTCLWACSGNQRQHDLQKWMEPNGKIKVLSTIGMIDDLVRQVGGEHIDSLTLITGELDPHSYQLVKGDDEKLMRADIIFYNGLGLEHGPSLQRHLYENPNAVALGNQLQKQYPDVILHLNGQIDPHIWMDISLWKKTVPYIVAALSAKDQIHAQVFHANGEALIQKMEHAHQKVRNLMLAVPEKQRYLVTSHDAFNYFTRAYLATDEEQKNGGWQSRFAAPEGLAPESQLSVTHIQEIIDYLRKKQIHVLFPESNVSKDSIRKIINAGQEQGLTLHIAPVYLYGDAMGLPGSDGGTYLQMVEHNASTIAKYLNPEMVIKRIDK